MSSEQPAERNTTSEFYGAFDAFRSFYKRGPESEDDLKQPGVKVHQTDTFMWLLDFDQEKEDELQKLMVPFTTSMQEAQRGRRFALIFGMGEKDGGKDKTLQAMEGSADHCGFIASVPWNAEIDDVVVLLEGFSTPFVLRKCTSELSQGEPRWRQSISPCRVLAGTRGRPTSI